MKRTPPLLFLKFVCLAHRPRPPLAVLSLCTRRPVRPSPGRSFLVARFFFQPSPSRHPPTATAPSTTARHPPPLLPYSSRSPFPPHVPPPICTTALPCSETQSILHLYFFISFFPFFCRGFLCLPVVCFFSSCFPCIHPVLFHRQVAVLHFRSFPLFFTLGQTRLAGRAFLFCQTRTALVERTFPVEQNESTVGEGTTRKRGKRRPPKKAAQKIGLPTDAGR